VTLYHLLTGKRPFEGGSEFDVARRQVTDEAMPVRNQRSDCPRWLARFVHRLLAKEPKNRWKDAGEALEAFRARRWRPTRRALIRAAAMGVVVAVVGAVGLFGADRWAEIRSSVENGQLVVRNAFGRTLWRKAIEGIQPYSVALDGDGNRGAGILAGVRHGRPGRQHLDLRLFGRDGSSLNRFEVSTDFNGQPQFPGMSEDLQLISLEVMDLGTELGRNAVWVATDRAWYPGVIGLYGAQGPSVLLVNSGHIRTVSAFDFDGDGCKELVVAGVNNELGFQAFVAVIDPAGAFSRSPELASPDQISSVGASLLGYALLGEENEPDIFIDPGPGKSDPPVIRLAHRAVHLGQDGAIEDLSLKATRAFWVDVVQSVVRLQQQGGSENLVVEQLARRQEGVWSRPQYRAGAAFILAKALAEADRPEVGAHVLEDAKASGIRMRRLDRRIGEMWLLAGDQSQGRAALLGAIDLIGKGFGPVDEILDLGLDDALNQDETGWRETSKILGSFQFDHYRRQLEVVFNFYGGHFSATELDIKMGPGVLHSAFVLRDWAAIEGGRGDAKTLDRLKLLELRAECRNLATLALARAEVLAGQPGEAVTRAGEALWQLQDRALSSWPDAVYLPLVQWAYGTVLEDGGHLDEAREYYRAVAAAAPNTFFGRDAAKRLGRE
jgi:hypothetical protein